MRIKMTTTQDHALSEGEFAAMTSTPTVFAALQLVMRDLKAIGKDSVNAQQQFRFRGIDAIIDALHPVLVQHGVMVMPTVKERLAEVRETRSGGTMNVVHLRVQYRFYGPAGDFIDCETWGEAQDSGDKATSKAMAIAMKYALTQALCIPTSEGMNDPDASAEPASRGSDPTVYAQFEATIGEETDLLKLRAVHGRIKLAIAARQVTPADGEALVELMVARKEEIDALTAATETLGAQEVTS